MGAGTFQRSLGGSGRSLRLRSVETRTSRKGRETWGTQVHLLKNLSETAYDLWLISCRSAANQKTESDVLRSHLYPLTEVCWLWCFLLR